MTKNYSPHIFAFCALFILGNAVITPTIYNLSFISIFISVFVVSVLLLLLGLILKASKNHKVLFFTISSLICAVAIYGAVTTFADYILFLKSAQMPRTNIYLLSTTLLGVIVFFCTCSISAVYKYSLFTAIICAFIIIICALGGIESFNFTAIKPQNTNIPHCIKSFLPIAVLPLFAQFKSQKLKPIFYGAVTGFLALIVCFFQSYLTLGETQGINYPYLKAVSVISSGSLFTRLDGLVYFLFFVTTLVKSVVCVKTVVITIKNFRQ